MKQRIISGAVGCALLVVLLFFNEIKFVLNIVIACVAVIASYELLVATKYINNRLLSFSCLIFTALVPFFRNPVFAVGGKTACFLFVCVLFAFMIIKHEKIMLEQIGLIFMISTVLPFAFSTIIWLRDLSDRDGIFYIIFILICSWGTDIGAYFIGTFFGKHKFVPSISPNKTIEGVVGGIAVSVSLALVFGYFYRTVLVPQAAISLMSIGVTSFVCAIASIFGDLSASIIKRTCNIKDFGNIMPGHGGVLDRFDSVLFVAPLLYVIIEILGIFPIIIS